MAKDEVTVGTRDAMPKGYIFVPRGNVYITRHCRARTHAMDQRVYVVESKAKQMLGLRVPNSIYVAVQKDAEDTAASRAAVVGKADAAHEKRLRSALISQFPCTPEEDVRNALKRTLVKRSKRIGRSSTLPVERVVFLAVQAHVRHVHTKYDELIDTDNCSREEAREKTFGDVRSKMKEWGWDGNSRCRQTDKAESLGTSNWKRSKKPTLKRLKKPDLDAPKKLALESPQRSSARASKKPTLKLSKGAKISLRNRSSLDSLEDHLTRKVQAIGL